MWHSLPSAFTATLGRNGASHCPGHLGSIVGVLPPCLRSRSLLPLTIGTGPLGRAVESVLSQGFEDFELLVVDDGSSDQTDQVLEGFAGDGRLRVWKTANCGVSLARNLAIRQATGEWIAFLDSDDRWLPDKLSAQFDYLRDRGQIKIVHAEENLDSTRGQG